MVDVVGVCVFVGVLVFGRWYIELVMVVIMVVVMFGECDVVVMLMVFVFEW